MGKVWAKNVLFSKVEMILQRFITFIDSNTFDLYLEKVTKIMFQILTFAGIPYILYHFLF
jgi:hypothetical protein